MPLVIRQATLADSVLLKELGYRIYPRTLSICGSQNQDCIIICNVNILFLLLSRILMTKHKLVYSGNRSSD